MALLVGLGAAANRPTPAHSAEQVTPIRFVLGTSSTEIRGTVLRGERAFYSFGAREDQRLLLRLSSLEGNAVFQLYIPGWRLAERDSASEVIGTALPGAAEGEDATRWAGPLPQSGAYLLVVGATRGNATFQIAITIR